MKDELRNEIDLLIASGPRGSEVDRALAGLCEALHREAGDRAGWSEQHDWLAARADRTPALRPWLLLARLAAAERDGDGTWQRDLERLGEALEGLRGRTALVLRTEAARHLQPLGGAAAAWDWLRPEGLPDPGLREIAADSLVLALRLAAAAGFWQEHDGLAGRVEPVWHAVAGPAAARVTITLAEHDAVRGAWEAALQRLRPLEEHPDDGIRLAVLEVGLNLRILCGGDLPGPRLGREVTCVADRLIELAEAGPPAQTLVPPGEWDERWRRAISLLTCSPAGRAAGEAGAALADVEESLRNPTGVPEIDLHRKLSWVRAVLRRSGASLNDSCESLLLGVIADAEAGGLLGLETLAWDLLAAVRADAPGRWSEALDAAGQAANLAALLLARNQGGGIERSLRANLLPVFDRVVELLADGSRRAAERSSDTARKERFGRALHEYAEQSMELALSEARSRFGLSGAEPFSFEALAAGQREPARSESLQSPLRRGEAVLQYFLAGRFLLVFAFGQNFFAWTVESPDEADNAHPLPVRVPFESALAGWRRALEWHGLRLELDRGGGRDLIVLSSSPEPEEENPAAILRRLARHLLPAEIADALEGHRVRRLILVPHDVLYRAPFGLLPWRGARLGTRFGLSLQPTGGLAGTRSVSAWRLRDRRLRVGFVIGPDIPSADREGAALAQALARRADVELLDTREHGPRIFEERAAEYDVLFLACHGNTPESRVEDACLELGEPSELVPISRIASLDLKDCGLMVLQSCWTGWMAHVREHPVQGFPQALLDAGARAVVAPMLPVDDALCPIFTAVYGRVLRFLPACEALARTLVILRRHGPALTAGDFGAESSLQLSGGFDGFEYRFTGDPEVDLTAGRMDRLLAWLRFHFWLTSRWVAWSYWWMLDARWWLESRGYFR